jgi:hypothetical protein
MLILFDMYIHEICHTAARCQQYKQHVTGTEMCDFTGRRIVFAGSSNQNRRCRCNETFKRILEESHQLVTRLGHGKINSWKQGVFMTGEEVVGHTQLTRTFSV